MERKQMKRVKKKRRLFLRRILFFAILLFLVIAGYMGYVLFETFQAASGSYSELARGDKSKLRTEAVEISEDPFSIILLGVENYSSGGNGRTDSIMVATINPKDQTVKLLSIPRDTRVYIEEEGEEDKINHAYVYGGKDATINAVEDLLDIPIDYYATVNFEGFKEIIDEIGGVTVEVPFDFTEKSDIKGKDRIEFHEGTMTLNGEEALAYARMRKQDPRGDFGRNDRQKQIITAAVSSIFTPKNLLKVDEIASHVGDNIETNMRVSEGLGLQSQFSNFKSSAIEQLKLEGSDEYIGGTYYFVPDEMQLIELSTELENHLKQTTGAVEDESNEG
ncbi:LCP family protein [Metabacillus sediminilitoris]|uniref:LytR family transcriptional regulator n=1 Tax=Metabacillus sediminilitoris TaxID=2567941 RepID=A0A4S4C1F0_9BACI|nr:LCP family protein [Metabacillus sediminilitoris]QGQ48156.1 LytR family transcriptional regulator [Metabacillus sediminilitoris]THF81481.1 LytR family transcriptional regulator [Metabacillus sediminilitoris]